MAMSLKHVETMETLQSEYKSGTPAVIAPPHKTEGQTNAPMRIEDAIEKFQKLAEIYGVDDVAEKILGFNVFDEMKKDVAGDITQSLMALVVVGVVLMVMGIILGNLEQPLTDSIPDDSSFANLKESIPSNLTSAMNVAVIIPIILAAVLILGVVYMLARGGGGQ
jgi:hypothetical protein